MTITIDSINELKTRIFGDVDSALRNDLYEVLCELEKRIKNDSKPLSEKAYDLHREIMDKNSTCWGDNECPWCDVYTMCKAAEKLRKATVNYERRNKEKKAKSALAEAAGESEVVK